ncbi:hypothetical protein BUALT_Bualt15G0062400 [Buddleja alternifolia]|uniref:Uncharacterized protein n=1 Tax=Buddleja alternifolia TaxID=168488 RepID=A0AAV6WDL8_9LAMI|nr:hypothetical protein BUALT_Bualt15G0062400 [Buddleja alternifolia]
MATMTVNMHLIIPNYNPSTLRKSDVRKWSCNIASSINGPGLKLTSPLQRSSDDQLIQRRSGNYEPPLWDSDYIQSLNTTEYTEERHLRRVSELKEQVMNMMLEGELILMDSTVEKLELIDNLQRLGISYHFEEQIKQILNCIHVKKYCGKNDYAQGKRDYLYSTALEFRLLRQHGFSVSQEIFHSFKNEKGEFKTSLGDDTKGLLQLYESSFMLTEGETTLDQAREFSTILLQKNLNAGDIDENLSLLVRHALELPLHWRVERPNVRWFINAYERKPDMDDAVLELAKLDFNIVQAKHQQELKHVSRIRFLIGIYIYIYIYICRWWKKTRLAETLPFARDRLVENYFWNIGVFAKPQYGYARTMVTKVNALITTIDDIFDVYGTLEELQLFNNAIQRWDIEAIEQLPNYMQVCYLALNNFINEMAYDVLQEKGLLIIPHLRKSWADLCNSYLQEAKWYSSGYTPRMEEYIKNAWVSISATVILCHAYFLVTDPIEKEPIQSLYNDHDIVWCSGMILRLANDQGTSLDEMKRGDVPKSIQCYMNETGASREEAQEYVRFLIRETYKKTNEKRVADSPFSEAFIRCAVDVGRMAQYMYQHGDGHGIQNTEIRDRISSLLFEPIV